MSLTRFPQGSFREIVALSLPLMISSLAWLAMILVDRLFLSRYSLNALNAAATAGTLAWAFQGAVGMVAGMSEVFVAQYNGAGEKHRVGGPVWQMLWFSLSSLVLFVPLAIWGGDLFFAGDPNRELETQYFRYLMLFGPGYAMMYSFAGYFVGQGRTRLMVYLALGANLLNLLLDFLLIRGVEGWIPEMGVKGAAIGTSVGYLSQAVVLFFVFIREKEWGARNWRLDFSEMKKCIKVGLPQGLFNLFEVLGWALFYRMMTHLGEKHITVSVMCQSLMIFLWFFMDGLTRGTAAAAGNYIGAKRFDLVHKTVKNAWMLQGLFSLLLLPFLVVYPAELIQFLFFSDSDIRLDPELIPLFQSCLTLCFFYIGLDGLRWVLSGALSAAGDTLFLMIAGSVSVWAFFLLPVYLFVVGYSLSVSWAWVISVAFAALIFLIYWIRFEQGKWQKIDLLSSSSPEMEKA